MPRRSVDELAASLAMLNPAQRRAVEHLDGPQLILAGPGSGKTRVVTHRIAHLLNHGVPDRRVLALTFTNKAADEMRIRVEQLVPGSNVWISTFHRFCARLLRAHARLVGLEPNFTIYDAGDSLRLLKNVLAGMDIDTTHYSPERLAHAIGGAKNKLITAEQYALRQRTTAAGVVARVYPEYQRALTTANAVDFDDLLLHVATLLTDHAEVRETLGERYQYILVDEYQDTNHAQYEIIRALAQRHRNLSVTGDPDQSIYGWRGANVRNILDFEHDFPGAQIVRLEQNYRSTKRILRVADALIAHNVKRKHKTLFTDNDDGAAVRLTTYPTHLEEAAAIASEIAASIRAGRRRPRDFAVFYRINALSRSLELALREHGVPYRLVNSLEFFQRQEIKDVMAYLHLIANPRNDVALLRVFNTPPRGIGKTTIDRVAEHARRYGHPLLDAAREAGLIESLNKRAAVAVAKFVALFDRLCEHAGDSVQALIRRVLEESGYADALKLSDDPQDEDRLANIQELITAAREFDDEHPDDGGLESFLEKTSLANDTDALDGELDCVSLMTIHSAKGLEFPHVYVIAIEHGILPHERSLEDPDQEEEERRLLFVAMTRAREELCLSMARYRDFRGQQRMAVPSQFLMSLPRDELQWVDVSGSDGLASTDGIEPAASACEEPVYRRDDDGHDDDRRADDAPSQSPPYAVGRLRLTTAAALAQGSSAIGGDIAVTSEDAAPVPPHAFREGMLVQHPTYGLGKIIALSGTGQRRTATVMFVAGAGTKKFVVARSPLRWSQS